jgi:hypothetical protein
MGSLSIAQDRQTACGPLRKFATVRDSHTQSTARARRRARPVQGSDGLPFALLRVPCDARVAGPWPNSLRSLRSLRSNKRPQVRARSARVRTRPATLCFSAAPIRPAQAPPGALRARGCFSVQAHAECSLARGRCGAGATVRSREAQGFWPRAYPHASSSDSQHRFDHSERSERRALCSGPEDRASQGTLSKAKGKQSEPRRRTALGPAPRHRKRTSNVRNGPLADLACQSNERYFVSERAQLDAQPRDALAVQLAHT